MILGIETSCDETAAALVTHEGAIRANVVSSQRPKPGTRVIDTGAPTITLWLSPGNAPQLGAPQDRSPYGASLIRRATRHANSR